MDMQCNVNKTVCMSYAPENRSKIVSHSFPDFMLDGMKLGPKICIQFSLFGPYHIVQK